MLLSGRGGGALARGAGALARCAKGIATSPEWRTLASGVRVRDVSHGTQGDDPVQAGQAVRVQYVAKLDDGSEIVRRTASFKIGNGTVCQALEDGVCGMRLGDRRKLRAPPYLIRGPAMEAAPADAAIEYDVQLTGAVHHMQILTLEPEGSDDPVQWLVDVGKRAYSRLTGGAKS